MKKLKFILILVLGIFVLNSCKEDFLETVPTDQVSASEAVATTATAKSVVNGIHRSLYTRWNDIQGNCGIGGIYIHMDLLGEDQVVHREQWHNRVYKWTAGRSDTDFYAEFPWRSYYIIIANANVLINGIVDAEGPEEEKNEILGQALVYRAWSHYQLVQTYGGRYVPGGGNSQLGVPYKKSELEEQLARNTVEEVYTEINNDLDAAIVALDGLSRANKSHINQAVAKGVKARVALTMGNWATAIQMAQEARADFSLMDQATYALGFQSSSESNPEFMWASQVQSDQNDGFGTYGAYISRNFSSSAIRGNPRSINSKLYDMISDTDVRKSLFDPTGEHLNLPSGKSLLDSHQRFPYTNQKFLAASNGDSSMDVPHMRAAEMYLIEAEAQARSGNDGDAAQALFDLVTTRDDAYTLSTNTGQALIDEIMIQRRIELWGEGFRFLDLKRLNLPLDRTGANHSAALADNNLEIPAGDIRWEWLIPREELDANPNMVQNPQ
ncbi:RagB/SusD family nutrient uptake outer membrane protein [Aureibaculum sp. 2210JD6-5]|uniref:RagB/SusD family nutrient uptake outer membrane protein n=1 Tax=Aureibaculum sp. 2210JD6-5 TaxID=3103957 RepID=UPI002AAD1AEB|nr:RagB/SusD family nutrient uptake outer membrane protein [Aureibaculum sp. 2210JD6-5]MDY7394425.1 RagB/SusD family nutrient uptake outer membrane protein [Aureibaculum sp. 2210JD6-5]